MLENNGVSIEGNEVDYIFLPGDELSVSHGEYRFENRTDKIKTCSVKSCQFLVNERGYPIDRFFIYAGEYEVDKVFTLPPRSRLEIRVTFPFTEVRISSKFTYSVLLNLDCDGKQYDLISKLKIMQMKPVIDR